VKPLAVTLNLGDHHLDRHFRTGDPPQAHLFLPADMPLPTINEAFALLPRSRPPSPLMHWYLHNFQFFVTYSVARDWAAFNGGGSLVNFSVTMDRPQCEGPPHNEGSGEISTRAEGVVAHGVILLLHVDLENRIPRGLTLT
jgi:hypothetical protein